MSYEKVTDVMIISLQRTGVLHKKLNYTQATIKPKGGNKS